LTESKKRQRATAMPVEEDETTSGSSKDPVIEPTEVWPKDEPTKDPAVQPTEVWPKDEPTKDPAIRPTEVWPKDEPVDDRN
jgi:hypothetical protein